MKETPTKTTDKIVILFLVAKLPITRRHFPQLLSDLDEEVPVQELRAITVKTLSSPPRLNWNPTTKLKFPCPLDNHKHKVSKCSEFFNLTPLDRGEKIEKLRMCYSCLKPKIVCRGRKCSNVGSVPEILKCAICAS